MKRLLLLVIIVLICNCATPPLSERVKKKLGDLSEYSDKELLELYNRADREVKKAEIYLKDLAKMKREETEVMLEGYIPEKDRGTEMRRERALKALEEWTEARNQFLAELKRRNLTPGLIEY